MPSYGPPPRRLRRHDENGAAETDGEDRNHSEDVAVVQSDLALCLLGTNSIEKCWLKNFLVMTQDQACKIKFRFSESSRVQVNHAALNAGSRGSRGTSTGNEHSQPKFEFTKLLNILHKENVQKWADQTCVKIKIES